MMSTATMQYHEPTARERAHDQTGEMTFEQAMIVAVIAQRSDPSVQFDFINGDGPAGYALILFDFASHTYIVIRKVEDWAAVSAARSQAIPVEAK